MRQVGVLAGAGLFALGVGLPSLADEHGVYGTSQLDTYGAFTSWLMAEQNFNPEQVAKVTAYNPRLFVNQFYTTPAKFGKIAEGYIASFTVINKNNP